jgi:hypothetical protein
MGELVQHNNTCNEGNYIIVEQGFLKPTHIHIGSMKSKRTVEEGHFNVED